MRKKPLRACPRANPDAIGDTAVNWWQYTRLQGHDFAVGCDRNRMPLLSKASNVVQNVFFLYDVTGFTQIGHSIPVATNCTRLFFWRKMACVCCQQLATHTPSQRPCNTTGLQGLGFTRLLAQDVRRLPPRVHSWPRLAGPDPPTRAHEHQTPNTNT